ncbi:hypothetical protein SAMN05880582_102269 [Rhizobium sp. RU20A]|uniref:hypothetical protein n=1 Tax=Rhizobium sp. RU20A TaxID=1907412 RepID=UPI0009546675|nr:hypothetical protein [Rhizobium sp. RU20A]SIQ60467.1 hypothetical protein SAMN05880582_102269 [Rhizobium sp. RU20A]
MKTIRSVLLTAIAAAVGLVALVFTASLGLMLAALMSVVLVGATLANRLQPRPVRARATADARSGQRQPLRVWNDGRGTIIDM